MTGGGANDIAVLTSGGDLSWCLINALRDKFGEFPVVEETDQPAPLAWRRLRSGGLAGAFSRAARRPKIGPLSNKRVAEVVEAQGLNPTPDPDQLRLKTPSLNSERCGDMLQAMGPNVIVVLSNQMLSAQILQSVQTPFVTFAFGDYPNGEAQCGAWLETRAAGGLSAANVTRVNVEALRRDASGALPWLLAAAARRPLIDLVRTALAQSVEPSPSAARAFAGLRA
ncbi:MAG: hypothetical protein AAFX03_09550 [Pseudomonadota bacterium]